MSKSTHASKNDTARSQSVNIIHFYLAFGEDFALHDKDMLNTGASVMISFQRNHQIFMYRFVGGGTSPASDVSPGESIAEYSLLYGMCTTYRGLFLSACAGVGYQENVLRGKLLYASQRDSSVYQMNSSHSMGIALQTEAMADTWKWLSLGFIVYANLNTVLINEGILICWRINISV